MNATPFSFSRRLLLAIALSALALLALALLAFPQAASAQDVAVVTEDQSLSEDQQGGTVAVSIAAENLSQAAGIFSYDITLDYGGAPVDFVEFSTDTTLTEDAGFTTDQSDDQSAEQASISAFGSSPLGAGADSGAVVTAVFEASGEGSGTVTFPDVRFNDVNPPQADVGQADFTVTVGPATTIDEGRRQGPGSPVEVEGTVTRAFGSYVRFQDESGPTGASGLTIRQDSGPLSEDFREDISNGTIGQGTRLAVEGTLSERGGLLLISGEDLASYSTQGQGPLPPAQAVSLFELEAPGGADYESELLEVGGLSFENPDATGGTFDAGTTYTVTGGGAAAFPYRVGSASETDVIGAPIPQGTFTYEGVLGRSGGEFALVPVRRSSSPSTEISRFEAARSEGAAVLTWRTSSETENDGFYVEQRPPETGAWRELGFVPSSAEGGTTSAPQSYRFSTGLLSPGEHRFRLRQVSLGGATTFSDTARVQVPSRSALSLAWDGPNPARTATRFRVTVGESGAATITLYDELGRRVREVWTGAVQAGARRTVKVPTTGLSSGTYFVRLEGPEGSASRALKVVR